VAPVEAFGVKRDARDELASFEPGVLVVFADGQDINNVEPSLQTGEILAGFAEQGIGLDFFQRSV
jgi:hypothetical protein